MYITILFAVISFFVGLLSYIIIDRRMRKEASVSSSDTDIPDTASGSSSDSGLLGDVKNSLAKPGVLQKIKDFFKSLTVKKWVVLCVSAALNSVACFMAQTYGLDAFEIAKVLVCLQFLMAASIIDLFIKKIPNMLTLFLLIFGALSLVWEFIFMRDDFGLLFMSAAIGIGASFIILFLMSLFTRGGFGMGDVKMISAVGFTMGIASIFYSLVFGLLLCLVISVILLAGKKKTLKDFLAFGPFFFLGFVISVIIGTF